MVKIPRLQRKKATKLSKPVRWRLLTLAVGLGLVGYATVSLWQWHQAVSVKPTPLPSTVANSSAAPSEAAISPMSSYTVQADLPRMIELPTINESGFVQRVGVDKSNAMAVPTNVHMAGWFMNSVKPGDAGVSVIDGHVQGIYAEGIFKRLTKLKPGDQFDVQFGDLTKRTFQVISVDQYSVDETAKQMFTNTAGVTQQLNLITCGGKYSSQQHAYDQRVLVRAKRVS